MSVADEPRFVAALDLLRRTGARELQVRYADDEQPVVWFVCVRWQVADGRPVADGGEPVWETAAALQPLDAALRLCARMTDGGQCVHCGRPSGFAETAARPLADTICWQRYDAEQRTFRRGCET